MFIFNFLFGFICGAIVMTFFAIYKLLQILNNIQKITKWIYSKSKGSGWLAKKARNAAQTLNTQVKNMQEKNTED